MAKDPVKNARKRPNIRRLTGGEGEGERRGEKVGDIGEAIDQMENRRRWKRTNTGAEDARGEEKSNNSINKMDKAIQSTGQPAVDRNRP